MGQTTKKKVPQKPLYTTFDEVESLFFTLVTDDMYMELTKEDTEQIVDEILIQAIPWFKFPKEKNLYDFDLTNRHFNCLLDTEEQLILCKYMTMVWVQEQMTTIDLIRQKYSGSDFKFTSQASHLKQLVTLKQELEREAYHLQSNYYMKGKDDGGVYRSTLARIMEVY